MVGGRRVRFTTQFSFIHLVPVFRDELVIFYISFKIVHETNQFHLISFTVRHRVRQNINAIPYYILKDVKNMKNLQKKQTFVAFNSVFLF